MKIKFSEIVDIPKLQSLMEGFYLASDILSAILDTEGNILVAVGWRDICLKFHRLNDETKLFCEQSDCYIKKYIRDSLKNSEPYTFYKCKNGLIDAAAPIMIDGKHVATIFHGQFLFEEPDVEQFRRQAQRYGFDEEEYLKALAKVPIYTKDKLDSIMNYFLELADMMAQMSIANLRLLKSQERTMQENEERLKTILSNTPNVAVQSFDINGNILYLNKAAQMVFGWTEQQVLGKKIDQFMVDGEIAYRFHEWLKLAAKNNKPIKPREWSFVNNQGIEKNIYSTMFPICFAEGRKEFICMNVDITERKSYEKEINRIGQLNLIGEMAAGIGHEVRNPMTTVRGFLQLLSEKNDCSEYKEYFNLMIQELDRANSIITDFLSLAKNKVMELEMKNLNSIVIALTPLIEANAIVYNQELKLELGEIPEILLDEKEIRQLILNLTRNGIEAMPPGRCLTIKTHMENNEIVLAVQDEGSGIASELIDKIGTPFFSTKENGTGLGLSVCYSIAARHNAKISIVSTKGGTTFYIRFKQAIALKLY